MRNFGKLHCHRNALNHGTKINVLLITHELSGVSFVSMHVWPDASNNVTYSLLELYHVYPQRNLALAYINIYISLSLFLPTCPILSFYIHRTIVAAGAEKRRGRSISSREHRVIGTMLGGLVAENLVFGSRCSPRSTCTRVGGVAMWQGGKGGIERGRDRRRETKGVDGYLRRNDRKGKG